MIGAYGTAAIRQAESAALASTRPGALMAAAARAVATTVIGALPNVVGRRIVLLVGSGNNGGDALWAGRFLAQRGAAVTAILLDPQRAHPAGLAVLRRTNARIVTGERAEIERADVVIDGIVGIGARPPLRGAAAVLAERVNNAPALVVAVDLPSGVDPETGATPGVAIRADITVTFGAAKTGLLLADATGDLVVADLGLAPTLAPELLAYTQDDVDALRPAPEPVDDKYSTGVAAICAGSPTYPGAAVLAVGGAVSTRPGLIRYAGPQTGPVVDVWPDVLATASVAQAGRAQAWLIGPGIGTDTAALDLLDAVLAKEVPTVCDADGLTLLAQHHRHLPPGSIVTPHAGEFSRCWPDIGLGDRLAATRQAAAAARATVLLKGHRSIIASPDGRCAVNLMDSPYLATAGSGDVLAGLLVSLLAAGLDPFDAAAIGAWIHGRAGVRAEQAGRPGAHELWEYLR